MIAIRQLKFNYLISGRPKPMVEQLTNLLWFPRQTFYIKPISKLNDILFENRDLLVCTFTFFVVDGNHRFSNFKRSYI